MNKGLAIFKGFRKNTRFMRFYEFYARNGSKKRVYIIRNLGQFSFYAVEITNRLERQSECSNDITVMF